MAKRSYASGSEHVVIPRGGRKVAIQRPHWEDLSIIQIPDRGVKPTNPGLAKPFYH